jgi:hypothetical protein
MSARPKQLRADKAPVRPPRPDAWATTMAARPHRNLHVGMSVQRDGSLVLDLERRKIAWLVPPISWVIRPRPRQEIQLDALGASVWQACDGQRTVAQVVDHFASTERLSFHEARVAVTQYLRSLIQKGALAIEMPPGPAAPGGQA